MAAEEGSEEEWPELDDGPENGPSMNPSRKMVAFGKVSS